MSFSKLTAEPDMSTKRHCAFWHRVLLSLVANVLVEDGHSLEKVSGLVTWQQPQLILPDWEGPPDPGRA